MAEERLYTIEEADAALDGLRERLPKIRAARAVIVRSATPVRERATTNGGGAESAAHWEAIRTLRRELDALGADGIVLRDADSGLVDFPARREGRLVYLCWRLGEERVGYWHEVDSGFGGRKRL